MTKGFLDYFDFSIKIGLFYGFDGIEIAQNCL